MTNLLAVMPLICEFCEWLSISIDYIDADSTVIERTVQKVVFVLPFFVLLFIHYSES